MRIYSKPFTRKEVIELYVRSKIIDCDDRLNQVFCRTVDEMFNDAQFILTFNREINARIRLFAPGMFQFIHEN